MGGMANEEVAYSIGVALLVVDMQNDFATPGGSLYVHGGEDVVPIANAHTRRARDAGASVAYTQDWHPPHTPHFAQDGGIWPVHCVADSWGAEFVPDLVVDGPVVRKGIGGEDGYSGFSVRDPRTGSRGTTELGQLMSAAGVRVIVLCGLATDYCVKETALDAIDLGYEVIVVSDGVRAVDRRSGDGRRAFEAMEAAGVSIR
jgi:nicotinamidase/pyrazinamidase